MAEAETVAEVHESGALTLTEGVVWLAFDRTLVLSAHASRESAEAYVNDRGAGHVDSYRIWDIGRPASEGLPLTAGSDPFPTFRRLWRFFRGAGDGHD